MTQATIERRAVLHGIAGLSLTAFARPSFAQTSIAVVPVAGSLAMLTGAGGNVLVWPRASGQVLVDSGAAQHTDALRAALADLPGVGRVDTLFNTHWHLDQVGGNAAFGADGATIVAHEKTRARLATDYYIGPEDRFEPAQPAEAHPTETIFDAGDMLVDSERIEYGHLLEAHTDGDIYVYFRDANVIHAGDAVSPARDPELDWFGGGWIGARVEALEKLLTISNEATRIVPGFGPVIGRAELQAEFEMTRELYDRMLEQVRDGMSPQDMLDAGLLDGLYRAFADPYRFAYDAHKGYWAHHNSLTADLL